MSEFGKRKVEDNFRKCNFSDLLLILLIVALFFQYEHLNYVFYFEHFLFLKHKDKLCEGFVSFVFTFCHTCV